MSEDVPGKTRPRPPTGRKTPGVVVLVGADGLWPAQLIRWIEAAGYTLLRLLDISVAVSHVALHSADAVMVRSHQVHMREIVALRMCRKLSPGTAVVLLGTQRSGSEHQKALDCHATGVIAWPEARPVVLDVLQQRRRPVT